MWEEFLVFLLAILSCMDDLHSPFSTLLPTIYDGLEDVCICVKHSVV